MKKPYDKLMKLVADRLDREGLCFLARGCAIESLEPLPEEVPGRKEAEERSVVYDRHYRLGTDAGPRTLIVEYVARYRPDLPASMLAYVGRAIQHWRQPVDVIAVAFDGPEHPVAEIVHDSL